MPERPMWYRLDEYLQPVPIDVELIGFFRDKWQIKTALFGHWISTVFLQVDHCYDYGEPVLFETMVFLKGSWSELYTKRYTSVGRARLGHVKACIWSLYTQTVDFLRRELCSKDSSTED